MGDNHSFLALDWVKGEIEETLKQSRQALESFVENPEDGAQMRFCLAYLHQVFGTLQMVEFYGAALLAEEMEKICLALINGQVSRVADGQEVLMRAILQLPPYLERVKASRRDLPVVLLPLLNDLRAVRGEPLLSETALFTPDLAAGERAPIQIAPVAIDTVLLRKIRQAYQVSLLGVIRNEKTSENLGQMAQVFARLEKLAGASPMRELWLVGAAIVEGLQEKSIDTGTSVKMLLGQIDRQLRTSVEEGAHRAPTELLKNLLYYVAKSPGSTARLRSIKDLYRLDDALPGDALVSEERARMSGPDREAMKSVVDALCEELARVKDALDLFVRKGDGEKNIADLATQVPTLKQVADTVAVLGLGQPRRILQEQIEVIDSMTATGTLPEDGRLLDIAGALLYVEATLMGMVAEKPIGHTGGNPASEFSAQDQLSDAQSAVLRESRGALEKAKDAVIEYIASQWNPTHLESIPELIDTVRGSLSILTLARPAEVLAGASRYVSERLLAGQHRPDWQEMDTLADVITSVEYYLERIANDTHGGDSILDIAERGLAKLGFAPVKPEVNVENPADEAPDESAWTADDAAAFEAEIAGALDAPEDAVHVETREDEVLLGATDDTLLREIPSEPLMESDFSASNTNITADELSMSAEQSTDDWLAEEADSFSGATLHALSIDEGLVSEASVINEGLDEFSLEDLEHVSGDAVTEVMPVVEGDESFFVDESAVALDEPALETSEEVLMPLAEVSVTVAEATPPKKPVLPVLTSMPEDNHDFDEEIREIFVEEAEEVLQNIGEYFPRWAANFDDTEALLEFRRGFHTLKGSGRMVGAKVVGELAWSFENMLNKVRDKVLVPDQVMVNLISEGLAIIPDLVEDFSARQSPRYNTSALMAVADAIARGETLTTVDVARAAEQAHSATEMELDSADDFDALAASLAPSVSVTLAETANVVAAAEPMLDIQPAAVELDVEEVAAPEVDAVLLEIFISEAETHLQEIAGYLEGVDPDRTSAAISDAVLRSLHTLKGSAGMAGIAAVAEIAAPMEHLFKDLRNQLGNAKREHIQALRDGHALINGSIANLLQGGSGQVDGAAALIAHIHRLDQERLERLGQERSEQLGGAAATDVTAATQGLVASFMELGIDHVLDASWELENWLSGPAANEKIEALQQELQRLQQAAEQMSITPLALLAERLAAVYARMGALELAHDGEILNDLAGAHDEIVNIFDTLAASQTVQPNEAVLLRLLDLLEMPQPSTAPVLSDEPSIVAFEPEEQQSLAEQMTDADSAAWQEPAEMMSVDSVDPELLEIFLEEADEVLEAAQGELDGWRQDNGNTPALAALQRHLHTLKGGARLAEIRPLGDLSHELEFLYEGLVDGRYQSVPDLVNLLQRCHDRLADMVGELRDSGRCPSGIDLVNAINAYRRDPAAGVPDLSSVSPVIDAVELAPAFDEENLTFAAQTERVEDAVAVEEPLAQDAEAVFAEFFPDVEIALAPVADAVAIEVLEPAVAAPLVTATPPASVLSQDQGFDPELLEIFMEEAGEIIDATSEQLATWQSDPNNTLPVQQLQRGLHTLKGGARMAEIAALGDLSHHLENLYEAVCDGLMTPTPVLFGLLHRCHDRLAEAVESLSRHGACPETNDLIVQIKSYIADPVNFQEAPTAVTLTPVEPEIALADAPIVAHEPLAPKTIEAAPVPENVDSDILEIFLEESEELAEGIETSLAEWLDDRAAAAPMEALLRHLHTLKGGARLAGLRELGDLAHDWENDLVLIQNGVRAPDDEFFAGLGARQDAVLAAIKAVRGGLQASSAISAPESAPVEAVPAVDIPSEPVAFPLQAESASVTPFPAETTPSVTDIPATPVAMVSETSRVQPPSMLGGFRKDAGARGPQEMIRVPSDLLEKLVNLAGETSITRSRVEMGVHGFAQTVEEMGATIQRLADQLRRMDAEMESQIISRHNEEMGAKYEDFDPLEMDQYSSLNQLSKALTESASDLLDLKSTLIDKARDTETLLLQQSRINTELQEGLMRSRMVPFSRLVPRLKRIVRQTGQEVNKPADLDVINPEGEMDRTLLERIVAPLEHMLRNAVDHGLEDQAGRAAAGKSLQGHVSLTLAREGGEVVLTLADDGRGINIPAVRKKALERGLIKEGQDISDQEVIQFIFHAGFSTAAAVTQISGRGVGMDVVTSEIKQMGGVVSINSVTGKGTTFIIRLPFTVAVNRALMVRIGEDSYAIPLAQIEGIVRASPYELETYYAPDAPLFEYAGVAYRLNYLGEFVHGVKSPNLVGHTLPLPVLLIRGGEHHIAIQVDQLIGSREIVVKSVGAQLASVAGISGATILGDGSVVIILDVVAMLRAASLTQPRVAVSFDGGTALPTGEVKRTRTVMVVDDSVTVRKVTSRLLERHGYDVLLAKDGMDAIAKLEDARPDIMLLDIEMPRMDGFEVASLVRHNPNLEDLPIIMITSRTGEKHRERAFQIGVNAYMGKPFQEDQLLETIIELLAAATVK